MKTCNACNQKKPLTEFYSKTAQAPPGVGNSGFDHQTAADFLSGKTVSDEAVRKFVSAARAAHDDRESLRAALLSLRAELQSREAEIAILKQSLMDAEAVPTQDTPPAVVEPLTDEQIRAMAREYPATPPDLWPGLALAKKGIQFRPKFSGFTQGDMLPRGVSGRIWRTT